MTFPWHSVRGFFYPIPPLPDWWPERPCTAHTAPYMPCRLDRLCNSKRKRRCDRPCSGSARTYSSACNAQKDILRHPPAVWRIHRAACPLPASAPPDRGRGGPKSASPAGGTAALSKRPAPRACQSPAPRRNKRWLCHGWASPESFFANAVAEESVHLPVFFDGQ